MPELHFSVEVETDGSIRVVRLTGDLDVATAPQLRAAFPDPIEEPTVVIDLTGLSFMGSAGINELALAHQRSSDEGWTLRLRGVSGGVGRVLRVTGVDNLLNIEP